MASFKDIQNKINVTSRAFDLAVILEGIHSRTTEGSSDPLERSSMLEVYEPEFDGLLEELVTCGWTKVAEEIKSLL